MKGKIVLLALALLLPPFLPAVPGGLVRAAQPVEVPVEPPVAGADWRVRRGYYGHPINESAGLHVLYFLYDNGKAAFYLDDPARVTLLTVDVKSPAYPEDAFSGLKFEDVNADGYNDLKIPLRSGGFRVWPWDPKNGGFADPVADEKNRGLNGP